MAGPVALHDLLHASFNNRFNFSTATTCVLRGGTCYNVQYQTTIGIKTFLIIIYYIALKKIAFTMFFRNIFISTIWRRYTCVDTHWTILLLCIESVENIPLLYYYIPRYAYTRDTITLDVSQDFQFVILKRTHFHYFINIYCITYVHTHTHIYIYIYT